MLDVIPLNDWYLDGNDLRKLIYQAGFNSIYSAGKYLDVDDVKMRRWTKLEKVPNGRVIGLALLALKYKAAYERLLAEKEAQGKQ